MSDTVSDMESPNIIREQILRFLKRDQIMPSYRNTLTRACLLPSVVSVSGIFPTTDRDIRIRIRASPRRRVPSGPTAIRRVREL